MTTTLEPSSEAAHDASVRNGKSSLLMSLRALSMVLAGLGSTGNADLVPEAIDAFEQALTSDDPDIAHALRGVAHQLAALDVGGGGGAHTHVAADVTDLAAAVLLLAAPLAHTHTVADITDFVAAVAALVFPHSHAAADITNFTEAAQDAVLAVIADSVDIDFTYDDVANAGSIAVKAFTGDVTKGLGGTTLTLASKYKTVSRILYVESPQASDVIPMAYLGDAATIIAVRSVTDAGTVTFNIEQRGKFTPATTGTNVLSASQVADTNGEEVTGSFNDATVPADSWLVFVASAVASSPTKLWVSVEYTID